MITLGLAYFSYFPHTNDPYGLLHVKYVKNGCTYIRCVSVKELHDRLRTEIKEDEWLKRTAIEMFNEWATIL